MAQKIYSEPKLAQYGNVADATQGKKGKKGKRGKKRRDRS